MLCTVLFFLFFLGKNQQMELQGSLNAEPHVCTEQDGKSEIQRGVNKQKGCAKIQCWKIIRKKPSSIHQKHYWAHQHETTAFDSNAKAGNSIILHKVWQHLSDPDCLFIMALAQHLVTFPICVLVELVEKNLFSCSWMPYRRDSAKAAPAASNSSLTAGVTVNM